MFTMRCCFIALVCLLAFSTFAQVSNSVPTAVRPAPANPDESYRVSVLNEGEMKNAVRLLSRNVKEYATGAGKVHYWAGTLAINNIWAKKIVIFYSDPYTVIYQKARPKWGLVLNVKVEGETKDYQGKFIKETLVKQMVIPSDFDNSTSGIVSFGEFIIDKNLPNIPHTCLNRKDYSAVVESINNSRDMECYYIEVPPYYYTVEEIGDRETNKKYLTSWRKDDYQNARSMFIF